MLFCLGNTTDSLKDAIHYIRFTAPWTCDNWTVAYAWPTPINMRIICSEEYDFQQSEKNNFWKCFHFYQESVQPPVVFCDKALKATFLAASRPFISEFRMHG